MALAVSQGVWGAIPGPFSASQAPIHEDVLEVALSGGQVSATVTAAAAAAAPGEGAATTAADRTGSDDAGDADGGNGGGGGGGGGKKASLWLSLPFVAALLPGASPATRQQAAMSINIALKVCCALARVCVFLCVFVYFVLLMPFSQCRVLPVEFCCCLVLGGDIDRCEWSSR